MSREIPKKTVSTGFFRTFIVFFSQFSEQKSDDFRLFFLIFLIFVHFFSFEIFLSFFLYSALPDCNHPHRTSVIFCFRTVCRTRLIKQKKRTELPLRPPFLSAHPGSVSIISRPYIMRGVIGTIQVGCNHADGRVGGVGNFVVADVDCDMSHRTSARTA